MIPCRPVLFICVFSLSRACKYACIFHMCGTGHAELFTLFSHAAEVTHYPGKHAAACVETKQQRVNYFMLALENSINPSQAELDDSAGGFI